MLIRFTVENFRSFYEEAVLSMIPGRMQKHPNHVVSGNGSKGIDVLRTGLLYGANASGKSNLIRAMDFAQKLIVDGTKPKQRIPVEPFRLSEEALQKPSRFEFEFISQGQAYAYGFVVDSRCVHEEWLFLMDKQKEQPLFERVTNEEMKTNVSFPNLNLLKNPDEQFLQFVARSTRPNQLFLTKSVEDNLDYYFSVSDWFSTTLTIIFPESKAKGIQSIIGSNDEVRKSLSDFLDIMNTGIDGVSLDQVKVETIKFPAKNDVDNILTELQQNSAVVFDIPNGGRYLAQLNEQGQQNFYSLGTIRRLDDNEVRFEMFEESDGTQRLVDLFPVVYMDVSRVFIIDELERSLHPNLVRRFIKLFLENTSGSQLIVSTHESTLLDLDLVRRDEIWFVEKRPSGSSALYSLEEFKPRADLDIRRGYLQGRFGAIPVLGSSLDLEPNAT